MASLRLDAYQNSRPLSTFQILYIEKLHFSFTTKETSSISFIFQMIHYWVFIHFQYTYIIRSLCLIFVKWIKFLFLKKSNWRHSIKGYANIYHITVYFVRLRTIKLNSKSVSDFFLKISIFIRVAIIHLTVVNHRIVNYIFITSFQKNPNTLCFIEKNHYLPKLKVYLTSMKLTIRQ